MKSQEIRRKFLQYFKERDHRIVPSSPVVPHDDPTLLFVNAGMNQFKDLFLGRSKRDYTRATTTQKCIRVGGKHNDLENVGHTSRHLTFFEMLGNFSFGDYFKKEAIAFAWDVTMHVFEYEQDAIWASVFETDDEAFELWRNYLPEKRIVRLGEADNFWSMGDTGPCGPCSELLYNRGKAFGNAASPLEDPSGEQFLEFWNLVFMEFDKSPSGELKPLSQKSIDTGAGLERILQIKMGAKTLFETDVLRDLITVVENTSKIKYNPTDKTLAPAFHVIADHVRSLAFACADGVQPSNVDRGYVLRKILRRALRYGRMLGIQRPFLGECIPHLVNFMGEDFPELVVSQNRIIEILTLEEEGFLRTLKRGGNLLSQVVEDAKKEGMISGDDAFKLKDTYGFPVEEIVLLAKDIDLPVDLQRYEALEKEAKERSRQARQKVGHQTSERDYESYLTKFGSSQFVGYELSSTLAHVQYIFKDEKEADLLSEGESGAIALNLTPFYPEKGGQVGDEGVIYSRDFSFQVEDTREPYPGVILHHGLVKKGSVKIQDKVHAEVDLSRREKIASNHTATHLLHYALRKILGEHVKQAGSVVEAHRLRFDFSHHKPLSKEQIEEIEDLVNAMVCRNVSIKTYELPFSEASKQRDIIQFFGEKYGDKVRVVETAESKELCGGIHARATGNIGFFRITKEGSIASGIRRIDAVTGSGAIKFSRSEERDLQARNLDLIQAKKEVEGKLNSLKSELLKIEADNLLEHVKEQGSIHYLTHLLPLNNEEMKEVADLIMDKAPSLILFLASVEENRCSLLVRISSDLIAKGFKANELLQKVAPIVSGRGGGKADAAQGGGTAPENLPQAMSQVKEWIISLKLPS